MRKICVASKPPVNSGIAVPASSAPRSSRLLFVKEPFTVTSNLASRPWSTAARSRTSSPQLRTLPTLMKRFGLVPSEGALFTFTSASFVSLL